MNSEHHPCHDDHTDKNKTLKERAREGVSLDGSARKKKEEGETAGRVDGGWRRQQFQVRRVLAVRVWGLPLSTEVKKILCKT